MNSCHVMRAPLLSRGSLGRLQADPKAAVYCGQAPAPGRKQDADMNANSNPELRPAAFSSHPLERPSTGFHRQERERERESSLKSSPSKHCFKQFKATFTPSESPNNNLGGQLARGFNRPLMPWGRMPWGRETLNPKP